LEGLTFDQIAAVEYGVLVDARVFLGIMTSTLSVLVAYGRSVNGVVDGFGEKEKDFFEQYIFPGSKKVNRLDRVYENNMVLKGDEKTKMLVIDAPEVVDFFP